MIATNGNGSVVRPVASGKAAPTKRGKKPPLRTDAGREAKQIAAAILEVLAGARTPTEAGQALGVSLTRYYLLEERGLQGLVRACEPRPRGKVASVDSQRVKLERECDHWRRACARQQALLRAAQRTIGLSAPMPTPASPSGKKRRKRKPVVRALHAAACLREEPRPEAAEAGKPTTNG